MSVCSINDKFWIENPLVLLKDMNPFPSCKQTLNENMNSMTWFIIFLSVALFLSGVGSWLYFLIFGILIIILFRTINMNSTSNVDEHFTIPKTHPYGLCPVTTITPAYTEEWQVPPPVYDEYTNIPQDSGSYDVRNPYNDRVPVYGQYLGTSNMLPHEEQETFGRSLKDVKEYMNHSFTRDQISHRNAMVRVYAEKMNRIYKGGCYDQISPL